MRNAKVFAAEIIGTMILMLGGPGTAVLVPGFDGKLTMVALGFGFALLVAAYAVGPISGCHINPAVTLGMAVMRKIEMTLVPVYWVAQIIGGVLGGLIIWIIAKGQAGGFDAAPATFATNLYGESNGFYGLGAVAVSEIVLTAVLVFVVLSTTSKRSHPAPAGSPLGSP